MQYPNGLDRSSSVKSPHIMFSLEAHLGGGPEAFPVADCPLVPWRILLVDDDAPLRHVTLLALKHFGQEVDTAASVPEALERLGRQSYDMVITDFNMPGGNGSELIRSMKTDGLVAQSIIITGQDTVALSEMLSTEETPDLIVAKPFKAAVLKEAIRWMQKKQGTHLSPCHTSRDVSNRPFVAD